MATRHSINISGKLIVEMFFYVNILVLLPSFHYLCLITDRLRYEKNLTCHIKAINIQNQSNKMTKFKPTQVQI